MTIAVFLLSLLAAMMIGVPIAFSLLLCGAALMCKEIVKISNPMISEAASFLQTQIAELSGQLEELSSVISTSMERVNGRAQ